MVDRINIGRSDTFMLEKRLYGALFAWCPICVVPYVESFVWSRSSLEGVEPLRGELEKEENPIQTTCPKEEYKDKDKDD